MSADLEIFAFHLNKSVANSRTRLLQAGRPVKTVKSHQETRGRGWHALRLTFATRDIKASVDVVTLRDWMGHRMIEAALTLAKRDNPSLVTLTFPVLAFED